jgi:hypothetical protein
VLILHIFICSFYYKNASKSLLPWLPELFLYGFFTFFWLKTSIFWLNWQHCSNKACKIEMQILHIFTLSFHYIKNKKKSLLPWLPQQFLYTLFQHFWLKTTIFGLNWHCYSGKAWELKMLNLHTFALSFFYSKQKNHFKKVFTIFWLKTAIFGPNKQCILTRTWDVKK